MSLLQNFYSNKKVLITGHTGFKGAWLSQVLLELGADVTGLSLPPSTEPNLFNSLNLSSTVKNYFVDIRDAEAVKKNFCRGTTGDSFSSCCTGACENKLH